MLSKSIDLLHKSHDEPVYNWNMHTSVAKPCIMGSFTDALWNLWDKSINLYILLFSSFLPMKMINKDWQPYWIQKMVQIDKIVSRGSYQYALLLCL